MPASPSTALEPLETASVSAGAAGGGGGLITGGGLTAGGGLSVVGAVTGELSRL